MINRESPSNQTITKNSHDVSVHCMYRMYRIVDVDRIYSQNHRTVIRRKCACAVLPVQNQNGTMCFVFIILSFKKIFKDNEYNIT